MATNTQDFAAIRTRFQSLWPSATPVVLDNDPNVYEPKETWARLSIQPGDQLRRSIALDTYLQLGFIYLQIFVPAQLGPNPGWQLAEVFTTTFRDWTSPSGHLRCWTPRFRVSDAEKEYFTVICSIPYQAVH